MGADADTSSLNYLRGPKFEFGYPPGVRIVDMVSDDMKDLIHPHWSAYPPVNPMWHYLLAVIFIFLFIVSVTGNGLVIYLFSKTRELKTPTNNFVVNLAISDLMMMVTGCPPVVYNSLNGGMWSFGPFLCELHGAFGGIFGTTSICTMTAIAYDRYNVIVRGMNGPRMTHAKSAFLITICWAYGIVWGISPMLGWNKYIPEGILSSCSFDYLTRDEKTITFTLSYFVAAYCTPLITIIFCYFHIVRTIFHHEKSLREQAAKMNVASLRSNVDANAQSAEFRIARISLMNITLWVCMWTPYAYIVLKGIFGDQSNITPLITTLPALLAKSSSVFNPIVFAISHPNYRLALKKAVPWLNITERDPQKCNASTTSGATITSNCHDA